ncbi:DUF4349 domain-containing protein [Ktedonosporobacter rubrisoli]|uniref:DUF4349 domain-containing protein n=1 Tax=Ktedonosporobacter rubrisoli TaxID=2509675 RepID=A0A4V0Z0H2_KTERU|nr:DUF4349 domain-containing protein [Ktedonosporobacter rubrisoli]QBD83211.1 DUF4349 domain-containing protein [Ktedonosporobacter rubrisoli]
MPRISKVTKKRLFWSASMIALLMVLLVGCGSGTASQTAGGSSDSYSPHSARTESFAGNASSSQASQANNAAAPAAKKAANLNGQQYLIKTLRVNLAVKDTQKAADDIRQWISSTDPLATTVNTAYEPFDDNQYTISISFSVESKFYTQTYSYLRDYASKYQGRLLGFNESVQDITDDYVDTQSRLKTLHAEQTRLLELLSHAQALGDIISIEQKLTDVQGQIDSYESRAKTLSNQVSFYTVTVYLQPLGAVPYPTNLPWNLNQVFHDAWVASVSFGQGLLTFLVWLLAFSIYIIPICVIVWLVVKFRTRLFGRFRRPKVAASPSSGTGE